MLPLGAVRLSHRRAPSGRLDLVLAELGITKVKIGSVDLEPGRANSRRKIALAQVDGRHRASTTTIPELLRRRGARLACGAGPGRSPAQGGHADAPVVGDPPSLALRYGEDAEFRVRLVDHTRGGPSIDEAPANRWLPQPTALLLFPPLGAPWSMRLETAPPGRARPVRADYIVDLASLGVWATCPMSTPAARSPRPDRRPPERHRGEARRRPARSRRHRRPDRRPCTVPPARTPASACSTRRPAPSRRVPTIR